MMIYEELFLLLVAGIFVFWGWKIFQRHPEMFESEKLTKGMGVLAVLAIFLMVVVSLGVVVLREL